LNAKVPEPADSRAPLEPELGQEDTGSAQNGRVRPASRPVEPVSAPVPKEKRPVDAVDEDEELDLVGPPR